MSSFEARLHPLKLPRLDAIIAVAAQEYFGDLAKELASCFALLRQFNIFRARNRAAIDAYEVGMSTLFSIRLADDLKTPDVVPQL